MSRLLLFGSMLVAAACAASEAGEPQKPEPQESTAHVMPKSPPEPEKPQKQPEQPAYRVTPQGIAGLPSSDGQTFLTLDEYLAHLEKKGHYDHPFWERMPDGVYRWNTGRGMNLREPKLATRAELLSKYGFEK